MRAFVSIILFLTTIHSIAQDGYREKFTEANLLTEDGIYGLAIPIWEELAKSNPDNANINYKLGRCYLGLGFDREQSLPYLKKAAKNIVKNYDPFTFGVDGAPIETYFYLAKAYHLETELDSADKYYRMFLEKTSDRHYLLPQAERGLQMLDNARELMKRPIDVEISNIGKPINSEFSDYAPIVSMDENTVYFTSRRIRPDGTNAQILEGKTGLYYEDMYASYKTIDGRWMDPELLAINAADEHSSVVSMSPDGKTLYVYKTYRGNGNIYKSDYIKGQGWSALGLVGSDVNSKSNEYFAAITADEKRLYFVSDREGGLGGKDIWYVQKLPTGEWGKALNLGAPINTAEDEDAPYLHPDGKTMYFSSNGHKSMGGYDIFYSQLDENGKWTNPVNLGYPVNTTDDDICFIPTPSGNRAYYSSKSKNTLGSTDIYVVDFKDETQIPDFDLSTFAVLKGWVLVPGGEQIPPDLQIEITKKANNELLGVATPVERNGSFVFIIPSGNNYRVDYSIGTELAFSETITIPLGTDYLELPREIYLKPNKSGQMEMIALNENVLGNVIRWKLSYPDPNRTAPAGRTVYYYDNNGNVIDSAVISREGFFEYKKLDEDGYYILLPDLGDLDDLGLSIILTDEGGKNMGKEMVRMSDGKYYEKGHEPDGLTAYGETAKTSANTNSNSSAKSLADSGPKPTVKTAEVTGSSVSRTSLKASKGSKEFFLFYDYNQIRMEENDPTFTAALSALRTKVKAGKTPTITIIGSASRVPTSQFKDNQELAEARIDATLEELEKRISQFEMKTSDINIKREKGVVQGPEFDKSGLTEKAVFIEYQYIRIIVN